MDMRLYLRALVAVGLLASCATPEGAERGTRRDRPTLTHGPVVGDVTADSAVVWARADGPGRMQVALRGERDEAIERSAAVVAEGDFTGKIRVDGLRPATRYRYRVWFADPGTAAHGEFSTAPARDDPRPVRLAFSGDLAGQNVCRDAHEGFPIFPAILAWQPDLFVGLGDMIYADNPCLPVGAYGNEQIPGRFREATDLEGFWSHWKYSREDRVFRMLLARTPYVAVWDDHEVANDFGPLRDTRDQPPYTPGVHLLPLGLEAFLDYNPIHESARTPKRLYRSLRWGRHLELFVLDTRQYRDAATQEDLPERPKTMLGLEQLTWLKERLAASDATWKVIVSSVPMSVPTGHPPEFGRDGWANHDQNTGYENELRAILRFARRRGIRNQLWIATDVHFGAVFRYTPFEDAPDFQVHEILAGPLHAALFPNRAFDASLGAERLFLFGPESMRAVKTYQEARRWFNFAGLEIDEAGALGAQLIDLSGRPLFRMVLRPR